MDIRLGPPNYRSVPDPREQFNLDDEAIEFFKQDKEIFELVSRVTGREIPLTEIDDALVVQLAGMVQKLGIKGAEIEANRILDQADIPDEFRYPYRSVIRGISMNRRYKRREAPWVQQH